MRSRPVLKLHFDDISGPSRAPRKILATILHFLEFPFPIPSHSSVHTLHPRTVFFHCSSSPSPTQPLFVLSATPVTRHIHKMRIFLFPSRSPIKRRALPITVFTHTMLSFFSSLGGKKTPSFIFSPSFRHPQSFSLTSTLHPQHHLPSSLSTTSVTRHILPLIFFTSSSFVSSKQTPLPFPVLTQTTFSFSFTFSTVKIILFHLSAGS